jgi:membrane fusion protein (multidrug efflux system)
MNRIVKNILFVLIALSLLFLFLYPKLELDLFSKNDGQPAVQAMPRNAVLPVNGVVIRPKQMENKIRVTGTVQANESLELRSEISGVVEQIYFQEGQAVKRGNLLVKLNDDDLQAQLERLQYNKKLFEDNEFRQRSLLDREAISREEYERALTELKTSEADIKLIEVQIGRTELKAPFDGQIGLRNISAGTYITPTNIIANLYSINPAKIEFSVPARYSGQLGKGDKIYFRIEGLEEQFQGDIYALEPQIDPTTRTLRLRALANNDALKLLPGQFARIEVVLDRIEDAIMIPSIAITPEANRQFVFVANSGKVEQRYIETGVRTDEMVQAISGLNPGDTVLTTGILQARPGMAIDVRKIEN